MTASVRSREDAKRTPMTNVALLEPEIAEAFPNDEAVSEALRSLIALPKRRHAQPDVPGDVRRRAQPALARLARTEANGLFVPDKRPITAVCAALDAAKSRGKRCK